MEYCPYCAQALPKSAKVCPNCKKNIEIGLITELIKPCKTSKKNIIVEIVSTERIDAPIGFNGELYCDENYRFLLTDIANKVIKRSYLKLEKLKNSL